MNYQEAINWIHSRLTFGMKPGLKRMEWFMEKLGHPERKLKAIHIAGTNGKGSTLSFFRHLLESHGFSVGTFTSPYIMEFNERISVNGEPINNDSLIELVEKFIPLCEELDETDLGAPTEFEIITAMAIDYFASISLDYCIFETGLGGRLDSTNIIEPLLTMITNIGLDHTNILGNTYEEIAFEKAGILKKEIPIITGATRADAINVIYERANELECPFYLLGEDFLYTRINKDTFSFQFGEILVEPISINMKGSHQLINASLALQGFILLCQQEFIDFNPDLIRKALKETTWPGRFEIINEDPLVIIDGAHNEDGVKALIRTLEEDYPSYRKNLVFSMMKDKSLEEAIKLLDRAFDKIYFTSFDFKRVAPPSLLFNLSTSKQKVIVENWKEAYDMIVKDIKDKELIVFSGSLYFISLIRQHYLKE